MPPVAEIRPTTDRIRETLFNWLQPVIAGARCLELFAGTGVLSIEAISRGAGLAVAVESNQIAVRALQETCAILGTERVELKHVPVEEFLSTSPERSFDVVFMDPPFDRKLVSDVCAALYEHRWLSASALIYVETTRTEDFHAPDTWTLARDKRAGNVAYRLYEAG